MVGMVLKYVTRSRCRILLVMLKRSLGKLTLKFPVLRSFGGTDLS